MVITPVSAQKNSFTNLGLKGFSVTEEASYVYVTTKPNNQQGILHLANVTAFNASGVIASGISNASGIVTFTGLPFGDVTFVAYAGPDYTMVIANQTVLISVEGQSFDLICDRNYGEASINWGLIVVASLSALTISLPFVLSSYLISVRLIRKNLEQPLKGNWQVPVSEKENTQNRRVKR